MERLRPRPCSLDLTSPPEGFLSKPGGEAARWRKDESILIDNLADEPLNRRLMQPY